MRRSSKSAFLEEEIGILVRHFGLEAVRAALVKVTLGGIEEAPKPSRGIPPRDQHSFRPTVADMLESIRESDPNKYRLLHEFLGHLRDRTILPESQDIRYFVQLIGLKDIEGKSRREMLPGLLRYLMTLPMERLQAGIQQADSISEQQRQRGFSVLTDKLLGEKEPGTSRR
jgi:hypothetical protein